MAYGYVLLQKAWLVFVRIWIQLRWSCVRFLYRCGLRPITVVIDGPIGAGKTTFRDFICDELTKRGTPVAIISEPVDQWVDVGILQKFYQDQKKYASLFQIFAFITRAVAARSARATGSRARILITERSLDTDREVFMSMLKHMFSDASLYVYEKIWHSIAHELAPDIMICLEPTPETCLARINKRARGAETGITIDYLRELDTAYQSYVKHVRIPVIRINAERDLVTNIDMRHAEIMRVLGAF